MDNPFNEEDLQAALDRAAILEKEAEKVYEDLRAALVKYDDLPEEEKPRDAAVYYAIASILCKMKVQMIKTGIRPEALLLLDLAAAEGAVAPEESDATKDTAIPEDIPLVAKKSKLPN